MRNSNLFTAVFRFGRLQFTGAERISAGRLPYTWAGELDGIRIGASREQGHHNDFDIEQERPVIYVE
jgi:hypothetical protein